MRYQKVLNKLCFLLKPGGQLLFSSPSDDYPMFYGEKISSIEDGGHVRKGYSFDDIENKMRAAGLKVIFKENYAGYFTQKSLALTRFIFVSHYPNYCIFVIATKL